MKRACRAAAQESDDEVVPSQSGAHVAGERFRATLHGPVELLQAALRKVENSGRISGSEVTSAKCPSKRKEAVQGKRQQLRRD